MSSGAGLIGAGDLTAAAIITVVRDTDKEWQVTLLDELGAAFDLTADGGWTVTAEMRIQIDAADVVLTWATAISGASDNIITLTSTAAVLSLIPPGCYYTDILLFNASNDWNRRPNLAPDGRPASHIVQVNLRGRVTL